MGKAKQADRRHVIRKRNPTEESNPRPYCARVRATRRVSGELASIQGLCWRYGKRETLADLFENVCMPALREHVRPYADRAREDRKAKAGKREG